MENLSNKKIILIVICTLLSFIGLLIFTLIVPVGATIYGYVDVSKNRSKNEAKEYLKNYIEEKYNDEITITFYSQETVKKCTNNPGVGCIKTAYYIGADHYVFDVHSKKLNKDFRVYYIDAYRDVYNGEYHDIDFYDGKYEYEENM